MKIVVFLGPPGVGKGTQAGFLSMRLGLEHVSTGALLRSEIASGSSLGAKVKAVVESGSLVNDELLFECLESGLMRLSQGTAKVAILDGVPRTLSQVEKLEKALSARGLKVDSVVALTAPVESLVERFAKRWTCTKCSAVESFGSPDAAASATCKKCGSHASFMRREDDAPEAVRKRLSIYHEETAPLVDVYRKKGSLFEVDGLRPPEWVYVDVAPAIVKNC